MFGFSRSITVELCNNETSHAGAKLHAAIFGFGALDFVRQPPKKSL